MTSPLRLAIIDDEKHIRLMLKTAMRANGFEIVGEGGTGQEAVELYQTVRPDVMLLDINMPGMTGEEALAEIMAQYPDAVVIMLTSLAEQSGILNALELGASHYIRKDTPLEEIYRIVRETWESRKEHPHA